MKHLALILSSKMERLELLNTAALRAGFAVNCVDKPFIAQKLVAHYKNDYHVMFIDEATLGEKCAECIAEIRRVAPKSRVVVMTDTGSKLTIAGENLTLCPFESAARLFPRLKAEVTRYRTGQVQRSTG